MGVRNVPWATEIKLKACGMREAAARVWFLTPSEAKALFIARGENSDKSDSLYHALRLRIANPESWEQLIKAFNIRTCSVKKS